MAGLLAPSHIPGVWTQLESHFGCTLPMAVSRVGRGDLTETERNRLESYCRVAVRVVLFGGLAKDRPYPGSTMVNWMRVGSSVGSAGVALRDYEGLEGR